MKKQIIIFEDSPEYVKDAFDQLGADYDLVVCSNMIEIHRYFMRVKNDKVPLPEIILSDCHFPESPVPFDEEWIKCLCLAQNSNEREMVHTQMTQRLKEGLKQLDEVSEKLNEVKNLEKARDGYVKQYLFSGDSHDGITKQTRAMKSRLKQIDEEAFSLCKKGFKEIQMGFPVVFECIALGIPYVGILKSSGHSSPVLTWHTEILLDPSTSEERDILETPEQVLVSHPGNKSFSTILDAGKTRAILSFNKYFKVTATTRNKRWDLLLAELLQSSQ